MGRNIFMTPGEGTNSYARSSKYQGSSVDAVRSIIEEEIYEKLDIHQLSLTNPKCFRIADFGCSTGHNSFRIMEIITNAIATKFEKEGISSKIPDIQVYFNDQVMNDFNTLFKSLPPQRRYFAAGVAGSFHIRLFPKASLHFAHTSWSLQWLADVPEELTDPSSSAWNKGRIHCLGAPKEVYDAYLEQFGKDVHSFLDARAEELVDGGLMALLIPALPEFWDPETSLAIPSGISILESCLLEIAREEKLDETVIDSFNLPLFVPTPETLKTIMQKSHKFSIERVEILNNPGSSVGWRTPSAIVSFYRSISEGLLSEHFDVEIIDDLFGRFEKKIEASPLFVPENDETMIMFVVLRRK